MTLLLIGAGIYAAGIGSGVVGMLLVKAALLEEAEDG